MWAVVPNNMYDFTRFMKGFFDSGDCFCVGVSRSLSDGRTNDRNRYRKRTELFRFSSGSLTRSENILKNIIRKKCLHIYADGVSVGLEIRLCRPRRAPPSTSGWADGVHRAERPRPTRRPLKAPILFTLNLFLHFYLSLPPLPSFRKAGNKRYAYYFPNFSYLASGVSVTKDKQRKKPIKNYNKTIYS